MMSFAEAVEFINPAYNPNAASFFPQPVLNDPAPIADSSVSFANFFDPFQFLLFEIFISLVHLVPQPLLRNLLR